MSLLLALQGGGGSPQTGTPGAAIRSWVIPAFAVVLGAVTAQPSPAQRQWTNPAPSVVVGAVTRTPLPASRAWTVPQASVVRGNVNATPASAVRTWSVPTPSVSLGGRIALPSAATRLWVAKDAQLVSLGPQTATPLPAIRTWVAKDAAFGAVVIQPESGLGGGVRLPRHPTRWNVTVTVPPAIRDWVVPRVTVRLGMVRLLPDAASRYWAVLDPSVTITPDPDEELLVLLLTEKG